MTEMVQQSTLTRTADRVEARLKRRYAAEKRFRAYGFLSIVMALGFLVILLYTIVSQGASALFQHEIQLELALDPATLDINGAVTEDKILAANYMAPVREALYAKFKDVTERSERQQLTKILSQGASEELRKMLIATPALLGTKVKVWLPISSDVDMYLKGSLDAGSQQVSEMTEVFANQLKKSGVVASHVNWRFFMNGDSRQPEMAGVRGAVVGSFFSLSITLLLSFPLGVATAVYLEEFAPKNKFTDFIEVNINNLAAVPSIVYGLLGLAVFLQIFGLPRSSPLVGALVLTLISLPTVIIASRAAMKSVPPSLREAALGLGASKLQTIMHHVLPLSMPGMLTGTILGMAHALGETAPLLMIGMVAFIVDIPGSPLDPSAVLPVEVFIWAGSPERGFVERTSAAIMVLLVFLALMNLIAIYLRKKFERRW